jgi:preprotein translocase subunit SecG
VVTVFSIMLLTASALMILLVLLHKGKGGGLSDMFGGGVSTGLGGSSTAERNLDRITGRRGRGVVPVRRGARTSAEGTGSLTQAIYHVDTVTPGGTVRQRRSWARGWWKCDPRQQSGRGTHGRSGAR